MEFLDYERKQKAAVLSQRRNELAQRQSILTERFNNLNANR